MKVLIATDGSAHSRKAVDSAAKRIFPAKTKIRIVSAFKKSSILMHMEPMGALAEYHNEIDKSAHSAADAAVKLAAERLQKKQPDVKVTTKVREGNPKQVILDEAEDFGADLIIVGSHGYGMVKGFLLGSVSQSVAMHAKCSVEIVRK